MVKKKGFNWDRFAKHLGIMFVIYVAYSLVDVFVQGDNPLCEKMGSFSDGQNIFPKYDYVRCEGFHRMLFNILFMALLGFAIIGIVFIGCLIYEIYWD